ncbi:MAG: hypothetical protein JSS36_05405 [Proteobacteria bacterium]|nr:hypothetical protein [Pseudomonadota bacterium]
MRAGRIIAALAGLCAVAAGALAQAEEAPGLDPALRINQLQVLGTHNSYAAGMDPRLTALFADKAAVLFAHLEDKLPPADRALFREEHPNPVAVADMLRYAHPPLAEQLDLGARSLEIDVNPDPAGGQFSDPVGYRLLRQQGATGLLPFDRTGLDQPGFKVLHIADVDFRSQCPTLRQCLRQIRGWSDAHPRHVPLFVLIEAKVQDVPILPGATHTVPFTPALFDALDRELEEGMGRDRIITPDDVRGPYATLNQAVLAGNWPTLAQARGKVLFLMLTATGPGGIADYLVGHAGLKGRMAFLSSQPGQDYGAFVLMDNVRARAEEIRRYVAAGYLVRTRADIETYEAKVNDPSRAQAAFASGAQVVSTDFERPGNAYGTSYMVTLPGGQAARLNPVSGAVPPPAARSARP